MAEESDLSVGSSLSGFLVHCWHPHFVVVEKPSGLLSQPGLGPAQSDSLISRVQAVLPELRLVHRLDRDTSGLLLLARDPLSLKWLSWGFVATWLRSAGLAMARPRSAELAFSRLRLDELAIYSADFGWFCKQLAEVEVG